MEIDDSMMPNNQQVLLTTKKKKCHGNRKDQRFRKKWRARGMNTRKIEKLLNKRKRLNHTNIVTPATKDQGQTTATTTTVLTMPRNDLKRKHDRSLQAITSHSTTSKSISSISMRQSATKKMKKKRKDPIRTSTPSENINLMNIHYRFAMTSSFSKLLLSRFSHSRQPMYLKRSSFMLFKMLQKSFKQPIRDKSEQRFLYLRLNLLDEHYFLGAHRHLWQSYLNIGLEQYRWPVSSISE